MRFAILVALLGALVAPSLAAPTPSEPALYVACLRSELMSRAATLIASIASTSTTGLIAPTANAGPPGGAFIGQRMMGAASGSTGAVGPILGVVAVAAVALVA